MTKDNKIILLTELIDQRLRKQQEIEFYEKELLKIQNKLFMLRKEEMVNKIILEMIENEKIIDIREYVQEKIIDFSQSSDDTS